MAGALFSCQLSTRSPLNKEKPFPLSLTGCCQNSAPAALPPGTWAGWEQPWHPELWGWEGAQPWGGKDCPWEATSHVPDPSFPKGALPAVEPFRKGLNDLMGVCQHVLKDRKSVV